MLTKRICVKIWTIKISKILGIKLSTDITTIYFDESGFTGDNLLNPEQKVFVYGSVVCSEKEAEEIVFTLIEKYKIQNRELKGRQLVNSTKGKKAIMEILTHFQGRMRAVAINKKFALAGKFFEYIFEPVIASKSSLFYYEDFHKFIANILYLDFLLKGETAEVIFHEFETFIRKGEFDNITLLFSENYPDEIFPPLKHILKFAYAHQETIIQEIDTLPTWTLDLTATSLVTLLTEWGEKFGQVKAVCDQSKPLIYQQEIFDAMTGSEDDKFIYVGHKKKLITFNLAEPIILSDSKETFGIQIADVVSASVVYALNEENDDPFALEIREIFPELLSKYNIMPDNSYVDLTHTKTQLNAILLTELYSRSIRREPLLDDIERYILYVKDMLAKKSF